MERTRGSQSEIGMIYQYAITAYLAGLLTANKSVRDYIIYSSAKCARKFDDIVAKIQLQEGGAWFLSLIQVKHKESKKLNVSDVLKGKRTEYDLSEYVNSFNEIMDDGELACRQGIPNDNIRFCIFSNKPIQTPAFFRSECTFQFNLRRHSDMDHITKMLLPFGERCCKFQCQDLLTSSYQNFLDGCYLYLEESNCYKINKDIQDSCGIDNANDIINYVKDYFNNNFLHKQGLHKQVFEVELQKIRLSHFVPPLTQLIDLVDDDRVAIWNEIMLDHDITIANTVDDADIEGCLYSCMIQRINSLLELDIDWNKIVAEYKGLSRDIVNKFVNYSRTKALRYWISPPNTLKSLMLELWKLGDLTLILKTNTKLNHFENLTHLGRSFVVIGNVEKQFEELAKSKLKIFTHLSHISNAVLRDRMLENTTVSLQGRKETTLKDLLRSDPELLGAFSSADIIGLMKKRTVYLKEDCLTDGNYMAFLIEDVRSLENVNFTEPHVIGDNITIECRPNEIEQWARTIKENTSYQNYAIYRLRRTDQQLELVEGDKEKLSRHFIDQFEEPICVSQGNVPIPVIGEATPPTEINYVGRYLRRATISDDYFTLRSRAIFLLSGDVENVVPRIKLTKIKDIRNAKQYLAEEKSYFIEISADERQNYWNKLSTIGCAIFDINVRNGKLEIRKYNHCGDLSFYILYDGGRFSEGEFFDEIRDNAVTVVTGEPGMGKSSLLKFLCSNYGIENYVLFFNLAYFLNRNKNLLTNPIECVFKEICRKKPKKYSNFLRVLREKKKVILVLDSFDEVIPFCEKQVLEFIKFFADTGIQIIIASRLKDYGLLLNKFNAHVVKLDPLGINDNKEYAKRWKLTANVLRKVPSEFATNPLYLNFLQTVSESGESLANITRFKLYEKVIRMKIERRLQRIMTISYESAVKEMLMLFEKLALVVMFGKEKIEEELKWECDMASFDCIKFGIVTHSKGGYPVFDHFTFVEFLVAQWLVKAKQTRIYGNSAQKIYMQLMEERKLYILNILCEDLHVQNAILLKHIPRLKEACEKTPDSFKDVDKLGRNALHIATICCRDIKQWRQSECSFEILNIAVECMQRYSLDMNTRDSIMEWEWTDYVNCQILDAGLFFIHSLPIELYLDREKMKVVECKHSSRIFPTEYFVKLFSRALWRLSINAAGNLLFLQHYRNREFYKLYNACIQFTPDAEIPHTEEVNATGRLSSLHIACIYGNESVVQHLIESGADVNVKDRIGYTPLHYNVMRYSLCADGTELNGENLTNHVSNRDKTITKLLLERGADVNISASSAITTLCIAARLGNTKILNQLLEKSGKVNLQGALLAAIWGKRASNVKKLLQHGADPQLRDERGYIPFHESICHQDEGIVELFLNSGVDVNAQNLNGETALHVAVRENLPETVKLLLENGADSNIYNASGCAPFHQAINDMKEEIVKLMAAKGVNVNLMNRNGETGLLSAINKRRLDSIALLLEIGADVSLRNERGETHFHVAVELADECIVRLMLEKGVDANLQDIYGEAALHKAAHGNRLDIIKLLLDNGADADILNDVGYASLHAVVRIARQQNKVILARCLSMTFEHVPYTDDEMASDRKSYEMRVNIIRLLLERQEGAHFFQTKNGRPPLHLLAHVESENIVKLLLQKGANVNLANFCGETSLFSALYGRRLDTIKLLLENGADINVQNERGYTPLHVAAHMRNASAVRELLDKKASVNLQSTDGETALQLAIRGMRVDEVKLLEKRSEANTPEDSEGIVRLLLEVCANINIHNGNAKTAVYHAVCTQYVDTIRLLLEHGADANLQDNHGYTPLHLAIDTQQEDIIRLLLEGDACVNHQNANDETSLHKVAAKARLDIIKMLLEHGADTNIQNKDGHTPLDVAANNEDIVKLLLERRTDTKF
ncbi:hypothetical protein Trydic_g19954 [Trypoxylus dichotomus]